MLFPLSKPITYLAFYMGTMPICRRGAVVTVLGCGWLFLIVSHGWTRPCSFVRCCLSPTLPVNNAPKSYVSAISLGESMPNNLIYILPCFFHAKYSLFRCILTLFSQFERSFSLSVNSEHLDVFGLFHWVPAGPVTNRISGIHRKRPFMTKFVYVNKVTWSPVTWPETI